MALIMPAAFLLAASACSPSYQRTDYPGHQLRVSFDPVLEKQVLELDPGHISEQNVREVLSRFPAPRVINLNGSIPIVSMDSFSRFLIAMGYPEKSLLDPQTGRYSMSSYTSSEKLAGFVAWYYEKEGMMPVLIGHSQGGMLVVKVLHELDGSFREDLQVWNPLTGESEERSYITDPLADRQRQVRGLKLGYASAVATGKLMRFLLGQWDMLDRLHRIPDTVEEFTGHHIRYDPIGGSLTGKKYFPLGSARVRNVMLPGSYSHITVPLTEDLAAIPAAREWINAYVPQADALHPPEGLSRTERKNILFAAEQWFYIKKHWCIELQGLVRSRNRH